MVGVKPKVGQHIHEVANPEFVFTKA